MVAAPTVTIVDAGGDCRQILDWPDDQPDVSLIARPLLVEMIEAMNEGRLEIERLRAVIRRGLV